MADSKISALTAATTPLAGTEQLAAVQGGLTKRIVVSDITTLLSTQNQRQRTLIQIVQNGVDDLGAAQDPWPDVNTTPLAIPSWATRCIVIATISNLHALGACNHFVTVSLGGLTGPPTQHVRWNGTAGNANGVVGDNSRQQIIVQAQFTVTSIHGTTVNLRTAGGRFGGTGNIRSGLISPSEPAVHTFDIEFFQV